MTEKLLAISVPSYSNYHPRYPKYHATNTVHATLYEGVS